MYVISVDSHFDAAHHLRNYPGECSQLHGHRWRVNVKVKKEEANAIGICMDFKDLRKMVDSIVQLFDHQHINKIAPFDKKNPTAENLARYIYDTLKTLLSEEAQLQEVTVWESEKQSVTYYEP